MLDPSQHAGVMRTAPEDLAAIRAAAELVLRRARVRRQVFENFLLRHRTQPAIAIHTALKGVEAGVQREAAGYFPQLIAWLIGANTIPEFNFTPFQESNIASEQDAVVATGDSSKLRVVSKAIVPGIEAKHPEVCCEAAQVSVNNEPGSIHRDWTRRREHVNAIALCQLSGQGSRPAVHNDMVHFCVRHAYRFDDVLDGVGSTCEVIECGITFSGR